MAANIFLTSFTGYVNYDNINYSEGTSRNETRVWPNYSFSCIKSDNHEAVFKKVSEVLYEVLRDRRDDVPGRPQIGGRGGPLDGDGDDSALMAVIQTDDMTLPVPYEFVNTLSAEDYSMCKENNIRVLLDGEYFFDDDIVDIPFTSVSFPDRGSDVDIAPPYFTYHFNEFEEFFSNAFSESKFIESQNGVVKEDFLNQICDSLNESIKEVGSDATTTPMMLDESIIEGASALLSMRTPQKTHIERTIIKNPRTNEKLPVPVSFVHKEYLKLFALHMLIADDILEDIKVKSTLDATDGLLNLRQNDRVSSWMNDPYFVSLLSDAEPDDYATAIIASNAIEGIQQIAEVAADDDDDDATTLGDDATTLGDDATTLGDDATPMMLDGDATTPMMLDGDTTTLGDDAAYFRSYFRKREFIGNAVRKKLTGEGRRDQAIACCERAEKCPSEIKDREIKTDPNGNSTKMSSEIIDGKKVITINFEKNSDKKWITLKTYLFRLFVVDTLHDFWDPKSDRTKVLRDNLGPEFGMFFKSYLEIFCGLFPEARQFTGVDAVLKSNKSTVIAQLDSLLHVGYHSELSSDLAAENMQFKNFSEVYEKLNTDKISLKTMIVDADKKSIQMFSLLKAISNQMDMKDVITKSRHGDSHLVYMKTLSSELDQATTPKVQGLLKSMGDNYFDDTVVTDLSVLSLDENCDGGVYGGAAKRHLEEANNDKVAPTKKPRQEIKRQKLHTVQVRMVADGKDILDYEIERELIKDSIELDNDKRIELVIGLFHMFAKADDIKLGLMKSVRVAHIRSSEEMKTGSTPHFIYEYMVLLKNFNVYDKTDILDYLGTMLRLVYNGQFGNGQFQTWLKSMEKQKNVKAAGSGGSRMAGDMRGHAYFAHSYGISDYIGVYKNIAGNGKDKIDEPEKYVKDDQIRDIQNMYQLIHKIINSNPYYYNVMKVYFKDENVVFKSYVPPKGGEDKYIGFPVSDTVFYRLERGENSKQKINFKINNILGVEFNDEEWFSKLREDINEPKSTPSKKQAKECDDDDGGSFGVSKLCSWMVDTIGKKKNDTELAFKTFARPMFLKMNMDAYHYISLIEHKLQVDNDKTRIGSCGGFKEVMPIMTTLDQNCGYLCSFFSQKILCLIENHIGVAGINPLTIIKRDYGGLSDRITGRREELAHNDSHPYASEYSDTQGFPDTQMYGGSGFRVRRGGRRTIL